MTALIDKTKWSLFVIIYVQSCTSYAITNVEFCLAKDEMSGDVELESFNPACYLRTLNQISESWSLVATVRLTSCEPKLLFLLLFFFREAYQLAPRKNTVHKQINPPKIDGNEVINEAVASFFFEVR